MSWVFIWIIPLDHYILFWVPTHSFMNPRFEETPVGRHQNVWPETKKGAPHLTSSHNNKTDLASTLPLDNNVTRKNGVLREAPLTEAGGSWKHIWWNIQKKLSVFCSIIRFHSTYLAVVNEHDSSMVFSSTQQIFLWRCITVQCPAFSPLVQSQALIFGWPVHWSNLAGQVHWSNV